MHIAFTFVTYSASIKSCFIGPKDFAVVLKKIGNFIGSTKKYFSDIQNKMSNLDQVIEEESPTEKKLSKNIEDNEDGKKS